MTRDIYFTEALREALTEAMVADSTVAIIGEDVEGGGAFGIERGLRDRFGTVRVRNSPISEATVLGSCIGAATCGLRPVMDIMFSSFLYIAFDQVGNQAARLRYMSGGQLSVPLVVIAGTGPSGSAAAQHSENPHPLLMQLSGIKVVMPSTPSDAGGLLLQSIRDPNPVVFHVDIKLMGEKGAVSEKILPIPFGKADVKRSGSDVTVVAIGSAVGKALLVADEVSTEGISCEVIDPRTLVPLDWDCIFRSVRRTGRMIVVDPTRRTCGAGSEIVSRVVGECWGDLKAAPEIVAWPDVPIPYSPPLEQAVISMMPDIRAAVLNTLKK